MSLHALAEAQRAFARKIATTFDQMERAELDQSFTGVLVVERCFVAEQDEVVAVTQSRHQFCNTTRTTMAGRK